jgi:WD40 repeat protein
MAAILLRDSIQVVDTLTGNTTSVISEGRGNAYVQFSGNSQTIVATCREATRSNWSLRCFDVKSGNERWAVDSGIAAKTLLSYIRFAISSDGKRLAAIYPDEIKLFDAITGNALRSVGRGAKYSRVGFHPDNCRLAASRGNTVLIWHPNSPDPTLEAKGNGFAFSPDGTRLATSDSTQVMLWDLATGHSILKIKDHSESISCLAFSPNGHHLASGSSRGKIIVWDGVPDARQF